jgi:methylated-DNA-[protein]-cysteine S-methyltransferase
MLIMSWDYALIDTPLGPAQALARDDKLCALQLGTMRARSHSPLARLEMLCPRRVADPAGVATALAKYFRGDLAALDAVQVDPAGTPFQRAVWAALLAIDPGTTRSYAEIARAVGQPVAVRAVGAAVGRNPLSIVVPCHRVIGSDGSLTGYAGGIERKRALLRLEAAWSESAVPAPARRDAGVASPALH